MTNFISRGNFNLVRMLQMAHRKIHLVYGGGSLRLMGAVSKAVQEGGSQVLGIFQELWRKQISSEKQTAKKKLFQVCPKDLLR